MGISIALRELLPKPSPACGSRFKNDHRHEGAPLADIPYAAFDVAFGGKADMAWTQGNVRLEQSTCGPSPITQSMAISLWTHTYVPKGKEPCPNSQMIKTAHAYIA